MLLMFQKTLCLLGSSIKLAMEGADEKWRHYARLCLLNMVSPTNKGVLTGLAILVFSI